MDRNVLLTERCHDAIVYDCRFAICIHSGHVLTAKKRPADFPTITISQSPKHSALLYRLRNPQTVTQLRQPYDTPWQSIEHWPIYPRKVSVFLSVSAHLAMG
jgi:hypothetical protein